MALSVPDNGVRQGDETVATRLFEDVPNNRNAECSAEAPRTSVGRAGSTPAPDTCARCHREHFVMIVESFAVGRRTVTVELCMPCWLEEHRE